MNEFTHEEIIVITVALEEKLQVLNECYNKIADTDSENKAAASRTIMTYNRALEKAKCICERYRRDIERDCDNTYKS